MTEAYKLASKKSSEAGTRAKQRYDRFGRSSILLHGDRVLVRNLSERGGPGKLRSHWEDQIHIVVGSKGEDSPVYEVKPEAGTGGNRTLHKNLLLPCKNLPMKIPNKTNQKRERRVRKDKCSTAYQIPVPQAVDVSDGTCSDDEFTITLRNPYTGQTVEEAVTDELAKPSVEEKRPKSTQSEDAISGSAHQGKVCNYPTVLEETEETGLESGNGQDPLTHNNNSLADSPELEPRPKRQTHPQAVLMYNTQQCFWKSITSLRYSSSSLESRFTNCRAVPASLIPTFVPVSSDPWLPGNVLAVSTHATTCVPDG